MREAIKCGEKKTSKKAREIGKRRDLSMSTVYGK
jgi:hypothetical protein